jgi:phosphatidylinositol glycan class O
MDNDTILMVFGDHGMTHDGNHGGASQEELRSVLFSYYKRGFHMKSKF